MKLRQAPRLIACLHCRIEMLFVQVADLSALHQQLACDQLVVEVRQLIVVYDFYHCLKLHDFQLCTLNVLCQYRRNHLVN